MERKTPLYDCLLYTSILDEGIAAIKSESEYMKKLVDQLLFLARGDMGRSRLDFKIVDVSELVKEV